MRSCRAGFVILIIAGFAAGTKARDAQKSAGPTSVRTTASAIRMDLRPKATAVYTVGMKPDLVLRLLNPKGEPSTAAKDFDIVVEALSSDGRVVHKESITLKKGKSVEEFDLDIHRLTLTGAIRVRTTHPELLEGGTILYGMPRKPAGPAGKKSLFVPSTPSLVLARWDRATRTGTPDDNVPAALAFEQDTTGCGGTFLVSPEGTFLANGRDAAELTLVVDPPQRDTSFYVKTTRGRLSPNPIVIRAGEPVGSAQLTSDTVGEAQITCVRAVPATIAGGAPTATVQFRKPVTGYELAVTPPRIPYVDRARITVTLLGGEGEDRRPIQTDEKRTISLTRDKSGEIIPEQVDIKPGEFQTSAVFQPYDRGVVHISASTPDFPSQQVELQVAVPLLMFLLPPVGGLCGGLLALVRDALQRRAAAEPPSQSAAVVDQGASDGSMRDVPEHAGGAGAPADAASRGRARLAGTDVAARNRASLTSLDGPLMRIIVGIITGSLLQWAMVFEVLPILPRRTVMSLVSWFFVPVIGGWLGTEVFRLLLNQKSFGSKVSAHV